MSVRSQKLLDALLAGGLPYIWSQGQWDIRIDTVEKRDTAIWLTGDVKHGGVSLPISWPVVVVNPPTLVPDPNGTVDLGDRGMHRDDPLAAMQQTFFDVVRPLI